MDREFLKKNIIELENKLNENKKKLVELNIREKEKLYYKEFSDIISKNEMNVIYNFLFGDYILKTYDKFVTADDFYINKVSTILGIFDVEEHFNELYDLYEELDELMNEDEIAEKVNFFRDIKEIVEKDDIDELIELFS